MSWGETKMVIAFDGVNSMTRKWGRQYLYGGLLAENVTQATARDVLVNGMFNVEQAGYPIVMHVHDEAIAEVPEHYGSVSEFEALLCQLPDWASGLPLKAEGWRGKRYKK
jgi:DNA polymerase